MAGQLSFKLAPLTALAEHAIRAKQRIAGPDDPYPFPTGPKAKIKPALRLIYGQGIYLQSNGLPSLPKGCESVYSTQTHADDCLLDDWQSVARRIMDEPDEFEFHLEDLIAAVLKGSHAGHTKLVLEINVLGVVDFHTSNRRFPNNRQIAKARRKRLSRQKARQSFRPF